MDGIVYPIAIMILWGLGDFVLKKASASSDYDYMLAQGLALLPAVPFLWGKPIEVFSFAIAYLIGDLFYYHALRAEKVSLATPLSIMSMGAFGALISVLLGWDTLTLLKVVGGILTLASLFVIYPLKQITSSALWMMGAGFFWSLSYPIVYILSPEHGTLSLLGSASIVYIIYALLRKGSLNFSFNKEAFLGSILTNWTLPLTAKGIEAVGVYVTSLISSLSPALTVLLGVFVGKERLIPREIVGVILALASILMLSV